MWLGGIVLILFVIILACIRFAMIRAQPILRTRVIETLSTRFRSRVELADLHVWIANGVHVEGKGLQIYGANDPNPWLDGVQPLLSIGEFRFQTGLRDLFREPMHVDTIFVDELTMNIPPKSDRQQMNSMRRQGGKMSITVDHFLCTDTKIVINTVRPNKPPLLFDIAGLHLKDIGPGLPLRFEATLLNPKPVGDIQSTGLFGPLNERSPRDSAVQGTYFFSNADLGTLKGIGGILSSKGEYSGSLGRIEVQGVTETPDFQVAVSGHKVPLHTDFHAIVDGTDGDTYLDPVKARVLHSSFTATGKVVRVTNPDGHDIDLHVVVDKAKIEDLLTLGVRTEPAIMAGMVRMSTALKLSAGTGDITDRMRLKGAFHISDGHFSNEKLQTRIDSLSLRGLGKPKLIGKEQEPIVASELQGAFDLRAGMFSFSFLHFQVPGTHADMTGQYSLDGNIFDFHGRLRMDATLSHMTTGWKSILLKPIDPFFRKNGAGAEIPFKITGTRSEPHFGLDFHHKNNIPDDHADAASAGHSPHQ
jgi:hypothetical protein